MATNTAPAASTRVPSTFDMLLQFGSALLKRLLSRTRYRFAAMAAGSVLLALLTLLQATNAYRISYDVFRNIAEVNATTVDASEQALQYVAQASQAAADYALLTSDTPLFEQAQNNIFRDFSAFRDQMTRLEGNLQTDEERAAFIVADTMTYSRFWRHVSNLVAQRTNDAVARREYLEADNHIRNWINPALEELENLNFQQMVEAGENAGSVIRTQLFLFLVPAIALVALLTFLSYRLRNKVRRYITPGIDSAMVLSYVVVAVIFLDLLGAPGQLDTMIQSSYRSVSASSRVLVDGNLANRAESSALLDSDRADSWNKRFEEAANRIELRFCGQERCSERSFLTGTDGMNEFIINRSENISTSDSAMIQGIEGIVPLMGNVTFNGEAIALENARIAYRDFVAAHRTLNDMIEGGEVENAILFNTTSEAGSSQEAFDRFTAAMNEVSDINRAVFDEVWETQRGTLQNNQVLFGFIGYALIAVLVIVGITHRLREL